MRNLTISRLATIAVLAVTLGIVPFAWGQYTETTIHNFTGGSDGALPQAGVIFDGQGNLYGTTYQGGAYNAGTVFRLSPQSDSTWTETELFEFTNGIDGGFPDAPLIMDAAGNLYGTTIYGGSSSCVAVMNAPCGIVFKLTPQAHGRWKETILHSFQANARDGFYPSSGLTVDSAGDLYGTTAYGGPNDLGTIFELTPTAIGPWKEKILHSFSGPDGASPFWTPLNIDLAGNLYGVTPRGGYTNTTTCGSFGCGVVFKLTPTNSGRWNEHVLYSFTNTGDGLSPFGPVALDLAGNLYGIAPFGGTSTNCFGSSCGVVFEVSRTSGGMWNESTLYSFQGGNDGEFPQTGIIFDAAGNLLGTTGSGGDALFCSSGCGTVFELTPVSGGVWTEQVLYSFTGTADGCFPVGKLVADATGNLYSVTQQTGIDCQHGGVGSGAVSKLSPPASLVRK